jgi:hypothetical protein
MMTRLEPYASRDTVTVRLEKIIDGQTETYIVRMHKDLIGEEVADLMADGWTVTGPPQ